MLLNNAGGPPITAEDELLIAYGRSNKKKENEQKTEHSLHRGLTVYQTFILASEPADISYTYIGVN